MNLKPIFLILAVLLASCSQQRYGHRAKVKVRDYASEAESNSKKQEVAPLETLKSNILWEPTSLATPILEPIELKSIPDSTILVESATSSQETLPLTQVADSTTQSETEESYQKPDRLGIIDMSLTDILVAVCITVLAVMLGLLAAVFPVLIIILATWEISALAFATLTILGLLFSLLFNHWFTKAYFKKRLNLVFLLLLTTVVFALLLFALPYLPEFAMYIVGVIGFIGFIALIYGVFIKK
ncbi:MAG: hypothetical protein EP332_07185 [Bacteroidetes bacterium]|nr:MAG: hypothetical protein EP332_07185 [Bacteroidota bacterium]